MRKVLIIGASGLLGRYITGSFLNQGWLVVGCTHKHPLQSDSQSLTYFNLDITDELAVLNLCAELKPNLVIHCAGLTNVDSCEKQPSLAYDLNSNTAKIIAIYAKKNNAKFVYISTDHLFDGERSLYSEDDVTAPLNTYGLSKREGEILALGENPDSLIIRTNFFGKGTAWRSSFSDWIWDALKNRNSLHAFEDSYFSPIAIPKLVEIIHMLIKKDAKGIFNVCGAERLSKFEFATRFAKYFNLPEDLILPISIKHANLTAKRPQDMSLSVNKLQEYLNISAPTVEQSFESIREDYKLD